MQKVPLRIHPYDSVHSYPLWLLLLVRNRRLCRGEYKVDLEALYERISGESSPWGVPSHDTLNRAISLLDPKQIELVYKAFLQEGFVN